MSDDFSKTPPVKKLAFKPGMRGLAINPPPGYRQTLGELPAGSTLDEMDAAGLESPAASYDWVHLFVRRAAEMQRLLPAVQARLATSAILWISFPRAKGATDLNRSAMWPLAASHRLKVVSNAVFNLEWTTYRFRPIA